MNSLLSRMLVALLLLPLASHLAGTSAAEDDSPDQTVTRDLVITEDTQIALLGKTGKAVIGSCKTEDPLWKGKIAVKNIGSETVVVQSKPAERLAPSTTAGEELPPHVRVYVPNNIELQAEERLTHDLKEFGQELLEIEIGSGKNKCRNYDAPPVFDERLSGLPGPLRTEERPDPGDGDGGYGWRVRRIQRALIDKGYSLPSGPDGDVGPQTVRALVAFFKDRRQTPPREIFLKPVPPETISLLLETLAPGSAGAAEPVPSHADSGDECKRGVNLVPIYMEIDPERAIRNENRSNNRVQFTVAIDCSNVAR